MLMPMMKIRLMRVIMSHLFMLMRMRVLPGCRYRWLKAHVNVVMMEIVMAMAVLMEFRRMVMGMGMVFGHQKVSTHDHHRQCNEKRCTKRIGEDKQSNDYPKKG